MSHLPNNILVTPCYAPDYKRCTQLIRSANKYVHGISEHLLVVDKKDIHMFMHLAKGRTKIITKESLFLFSLQRLPMQKNYWLVGKVGLTRGWILQQVVKLAVAFQSRADAIIYADADVMFVDKFDAQSYWQGNALRFFETNRGPFMYSSRRYKNWYQSGSRMLDLGNQEDFNGAYIAQLNAVKPKHVRAMCGRIQRVVDCSWKRELLASLDYSEFILYGLYIRYCVTNPDEYFITDLQQCESSWFHHIQSKEDALRFIRESRELSCAVHLQSNLGLDLDLKNA
jgi:hypothetical protein